MKTEIITRRCANCGLETARGLFCNRCDTVTYLSWMFEQFHGDPYIRSKFVEEQYREKINCGADLQKVAESRGAPRLKWLAKSITRLCYKYDLPAQCNIYARALRHCEAKAKAEIAVIERKRIEVIECPESILADEVADKILQQAKGNFSRKDPTWSADYDKNQKAYAGFTPAQSDPENLF